MVYSLEERQFNKGLFDIVFSRISNEQAQTNRLLTQILSSMGGSSTSLVELKKQLESGQITGYRIFKLKMDTAATSTSPFKLVVDGNHVTAVSDGSMSGVYVHFNVTTNDAVPLEYFDGDMKFSQLFFEWPAQAGKTLYVAIGQANIGVIRHIDNNQQSASLYRWGIDIEPSWTFAAEQVAPGAGAALVTQVVTAGKSGYVYGFFISTQEANDFLLSWTSGGIAKSKRIVFAGSGAYEVIDNIALNSGLLADALTNITISNVNAAGAGKIYQANLLYAEK
jgi:hypothetical protein